MIPPEDHSVNITLHLILWGVLILITIFVFIYKRWLEKRDNPYIHLHADQHDASVINAQTTMAKRLDTIDKVKNGLLAAVILWGLAIAAIAIYKAWNAGT